MAEDKKGKGPKDPREDGGRRSGKDGGKGLSIKQIEAGFGGAMAKDVASKEQAKSFKEMVDLMKDQSENIVKGTDLNVDVRKQIEKLEGAFGIYSNDNTKALREQFMSLDAVMQEQISLQEQGLPYNQELLDRAQEQLETLQEGVKSEEEAREANKKQDEANSTLLKIANSTEKMGEGIAKFAGGAGAMAGIIGLALALFSPETFIAIITKIIDTVSDIFQGITDLLEGDIEGFLEMIQDNFLLFAGLLGYMVLTNLPRVLRFLRILGNAFKVFRLFMISDFVKNMLAHLGTMMSAVGGAFMKAFQFLVRGFQMFRVFMVSTFIPAMWTGFMAIMSTLSAALAPLIAFVVANPIVWIIAGIVAIAGLFTWLASSLTGWSIMDTLKVAWGYVQDGMAMFANIFIDIANMVMGLVNKFAGWLGFDVEMPTFDRMDTENAARAKAEAEQNRIDREAREAVEAENQNQPDQIMPETPDMSQFQMPDFDAETPTDYNQQDSFSSDEEAFAWLQGNDPTTGDDLAAQAAAGQGYAMDLNSGSTSVVQTSSNVSTDNSSRQYVTTERMSQFNQYVTGAGITANSR